MADRRSVLKGLALLAGPGRRVHASLPASPQPVAARPMHAGEAALMRGDAEQAMQAFELAASSGHAHAHELGLVRAAMQAGRYRQAMAFAAHAAAEHARDADCVAAYVWLLNLGGQHELARRVGADALALTAEAAVGGQARDAGRGGMPVTTATTMVAIQACVMPSRHGSTPGP